METRPTRDDSRDVVIAGAAAVTALGDSLEAAWQPLLDGRSAVAPVTRFRTESVPFRSAACAPGLEAEARARGAENLTLELMRRALEQLPPVPAGTFVIWAGVKGNAEAIDRQGARGTAPLKEPWLAEHFRTRVASLLGLALEDGLEVNAACASSAVGLALGATKIASGERHSVLVCAADLVTRFTFMGFSALKALSPSVCRPFDRGRDGLVLGDGAAAVLLTSAALASRHGLDRDVRLTGFGLANDATHITGPAADGCGLIRAVRTALARAGLQANAVEAFCAHGTGTPYNDAMELTALESVFGERRFPLFSVKGAIGHTLGAAGAVEAALCALGLRRRIVPATAGLADPEERAHGRAGPEPQRIPGNNILTTNSGFGGVNAALVLETG